MTPSYAAALLDVLAELDDRDPFWWSPEAPTLVLAATDALTGPAG